MKHVPAEAPRGFILRWLRFRPRVALVGMTALFLVAVAEFHDRERGFTSLLSIGDILGETKVTALRGVPHHVYEGSAGYDGAYYVQLALNPALDNPELLRAIDNLPYRARRILTSWSAWLLGAGRPAWVVQAYALLNVGCWLALGWVLLRWFPPDNWGNVLRWGAVMFSHGLCMSVRHSLVDGPALLLVALAVRWLEDGRGIAGGAALALSGLAKETSLLAAAGLRFDPRSPRTWSAVAGRVALVALPLFAWMAYVRLRFGPAEDPGIGNFTYPFSGYVEKLGSALRDATATDATPLAWATLATVLALAVQWAFFAFRPRPDDRWWRIGAAFAAMMVFLSTPVWEGFPGASTRVLLPMTLAFNILVPRGRRWLPVLLVGNLTVAAAVFEYSPPREFFAVRADQTLRDTVRVSAGKGWHGPERHGRNTWRWSAGRAELRLHNSSGVPVKVALAGQAGAGSGEQRVRVTSGERMLYGGTFGVKPGEMRFGFTLPPGETVLIFEGDQPGRRIGTDPRELAYQVINLEISVRP
jgi:hypothetical protein